MSRYKLRRFSLISKQKEYLDLNDRFVTRICIECFLRILRVRPVCDSETLEFLCWLLGEERVKLSEYMRYLLAGKIEEDSDDAKGSFGADFSDDLEEYLKKASIQN